VPGKKRIALTPLLCPAQLCTQRLGRKHASDSQRLSRGGATHERPCVRCRVGVAHDVVRGTRPGTSTRWLGLLGSSGAKHETSRRCPHTTPGMHACIRMHACAQTHTPHPPGSPPLPCRGRRWSGPWPPPPLLSWPPPSSPRALRCRRAAPRSAPAAPPPCPPRARAAAA
jgi:hypothetical protein